MAISTANIFNWANQFDGTDAKQKIAVTDSILKDLKRDRAQSSREYMKPAPPSSFKEVSSARCVSGLWGWASRTGLASKVLHPNHQRGTHAEMLLNLMHAISFERQEHHYGGGGELYRDMMENTVRRMTVADAGKVAVALLNATSSPIVPSAALEDLASEIITPYPNSDLAESVRAEMMRATSALGSTLSDDPDAVPEDFFRAVLDEQVKSAAAGEGVW